MPSSTTSPDLVFQNMEIAQLNQSRPKPEFTFEPSLGGALRTQINKADFDQKNAAIDALIAAVPERRAKAREEAGAAFRRGFGISARKSDLRQAFWKAADRDYGR